MSNQQSQNNNLTDDYKRRISYTVSFKLDVCTYLRVHNASISACARFFGLANKQATLNETRKHTG